MFWKVLTFSCVLLLHFVFETFEDQMKRGDKRWPFPFLWKFIWVSWHSLKWKIKEIVGKSTKNKHKFRFLIWEKILLSEAFLTIADGILVKKLIRMEIINFCLMLHIKIQLSEFTFAKICLKPEIKKKT